jgi:signal transduction histidine kinase
MLVLALTGLAAGAVVTEHRRTELQLRRHQESLARVARLGSMGEFAAMIAHEINQPLMAAGTYTRLVAAGLRGPGPLDPDAIESADKAAAQVERAADVVRRLRALIRLDQSGRAPVAAERIVRETMNIAGHDLERHGIAVIVDLAPDLPPVMADLLQIEQVLLNLLRNASEAMQAADHPDGEIVITARRADAGWVRIEVRDTGPGLTPDQIDAGPQPLASTKPDGLGIGLPLCRSIVEAHGGEFTIEAAAKGGTVARLTLPAARTG